MAKLISSKKSAYTPVKRQKTYNKVTDDVKCKLISDIKSKNLSLEKVPFLLLKKIFF